MGQQQVSCPSEKDDLALTVSESRADSIPEVLPGDGRQHRCDTLDIILDEMVDAMAEDDRSATLDEMHSPSKQMQRPVADVSSGRTDLQSSFEKDQQAEDTGCKCFGHDAEEASSLRRLPGDRPQLVTDDNAYPSVPAVNPEKSEEMQCSHRWHTVETPYVDIVKLRGKTGRTVDTVSRCCSSSGQIQGFTEAHSYLDPSCTKFSLEELTRNDDIKNWAPPEGVDPRIREKYLSESDFLSV